MNQYSFLINKNNLNINKCTIIGKAIIIDTDSGKYVLKAKNNNKLFNYLKSRKFYNYPKIFDYDRENGIYEFINNVEYDEDEKILDLIKLTANLHNKTSYYKEVTSDDFKIIYEEIKNNIDYIFNYYLDLINIIDNKIYPSPSEYLLQRNISKIFSCIYYVRNNIDKWYDEVKDLKRKRVATLHNNLDTSNLLKNENIYLISWNSKIDIPIYDLVKLYKKRCLDYDFEFLFKEYEKIFQLNSYERDLLFILISIPYKIKLDLSEYDNVKNVSLLLDKIYKTELLLNFKKKKKVVIQVSKNIKINKKTLNGVVTKINNII